MHSPQRGRLLGSSILAFGLLTGSGCLSFCNPVEKPCAELVEACHACPQPCRNHVYIFLMNGFDPTNCCNLTGLRDCLQGLGYLKTYYGCPGHIWWFNAEICRLHKEDPDARFVLVGYGFGGNLIDSIAGSARKEWIPIDLMVYLDCNTVDINPANRPDNVARAVNIWSDGNLLPAVQLSDAENIHLANSGPFASPSDLVTLEKMTEELGLVASRVPVEVADDPAPAVPPETAPTPRPVMPQVSKRRDDWDFLKPVNRLDAWPVLTGRRKPEKPPQSPQAAPEKVTVHEPARGQR